MLGRLSRLAAVLLIAACGDIPAASSSRIRSKISTFASTAIPTVNTMPAMPGSDSAAEGLELIGADARGGVLRRQEDLPLPLLGRAARLARTSGQREQQPAAKRDPLQRAVSSSHGEDQGSSASQEPSENQRALSCVRMPVFSSVVR